MTVEVCPNGPLMDAPAEAREMNRAAKLFMDRVESVKVLEILKVDFERGEETLVCDIAMKEGYAIEDLELPGTLGSLEVLKTDGRTYVCFLRCIVRDEFLRQKMREFDLDVIWTTPMHQSRDSIVYTCIGDSRNLNKVLLLMSTYGEVRNVVFEEASFSKNSLLDNLTLRQRDLLIAAKRYGYYEYPRRITSQQLAEKLGISKSTAIEHLRRGEARVISALLVGY